MNIYYLIHILESNSLFTISKFINNMHNIKDIILKCLNLSLYLLYILH